ncbi:U-scoloptoxin(16)-Ssd1a-like [Anopheles albimanus]|uniref:SVWC domain-containing protein n=1 Tax=Anopheles albimanus TaxID=7167 RepID=A0A182FJH1_ANOAL|nr:U-scoloptoxin(16)-Ssd1a-like [Anopheles albimanus]
MVHRRVALGVLGALTLVACLLPTASAYVYLNPSGKSPDQDGHCYDKDTKTTFAIGETRQRAGRCESMHCTDDYVISIMGCGAIGAGPGTRVTETDFSKPYPECCPQLVRDDGPVTGDGKPE